MSNDKVGSILATGATRVARFAMLSVIVSAVPAVAQIVPPGVAPPAPIVPPAAQGTAPQGTVADPWRVYGDDSPAFAPLELLGGLGLHATASLVGEYNDNVARRDSSAPLRPGFSSRDDWIFRPSLTLSAGRALGRQQLYLVGNVGRDFYARNGILNRNRASLDGGLNWVMGARCGGQVRGGYSTRGTQFSLFEDVVPSTQERWHFQAGGTCRTATGISANLNYNRGSIRNHTDDPTGVIDRSFADSNSQGVSGGIGYPLGRRGEIGVQGQWSDYQFVRQFLPDGERNGSRIYGANAFASYRVGRNLNVNGGLGKSWVKPRNNLVDTFSGVTWNLGLNYTGPRLGATVSTGRSVNGGGGGAANYSVGRFVNGAVSYRANDRLSLSSGFSLANSGYHGFSLVPDTLEVRNTRTRRYFVGADYRMNRILAFSLDYSHQRRTSDPTSFNYSANSVSLAARASF